MPIRSLITWLSAIDKFCAFYSTLE
jgi:hypothetical protein